MSIQTELSDIKNVVGKLDQNRMENFSYTQLAFDTDDVDGVEVYNHAAEQNIPKAGFTDINPTVRQKGIRSQSASFPRAGFNHHVGRASYNLNKLVQKVFQLVNLLSFAIKNGGSRYDDHVVYSDGDVCFDYDVYNVITWYKRNNTFSNSPVPLLPLYWDIIRDSTATAASDGLMLAVDKAKLDGVEDGSVATVTLIDQAASGDLPPLVKTPIRQILQVVRDCLKWLIDKVSNIHPIGSKYIQYPGDNDPFEEGLPGTWVNCNTHAEIYELVPDSWQNSSWWNGLTNYAQGQNIANGAYRVYQYNGDDRQVWQANKAISSAPAQMNPLDWNLVPNIIRKRRRDVQSSWADPDLAIGATVVYGGVTYRVAGILVLAGKFLSFSGGNRPTFVSGGVAGDVSRPIEGEIEIQHAFFYNAKGAFKQYEKNTTYATGTNVYNNYISADMKSSRVVPTGLEFSPRCLSTIIWRRVA